MSGRDSPGAKPTDVHCMKCGKRRGWNPHESVDQQLCSSCTRERTAPPVMGCPHTPQCRGSAKRCVHLPDPAPSDDAPPAEPCSGSAPLGGPQCPAGDACEHAVYLEEYKRVDAEHTAQMRKRIAELEAAQRAPQGAPTVRRPTLDEAVEYTERRERAARADGDLDVANAYAIIADYLRSARFDVLPGDAPPAEPCSGSAQPCKACKVEAEHGSEEDPHPVAGWMHSCVPAERHRVRLSSPGKPVVVDAESEDDLVWFVNRWTSDALRSSAAPSTTVTDAQHDALLEENRRLYLENIELRSGLNKSATQAEIDRLCAEVEMLRGVGCNEDGDGPCGACLKCALAGRHVQSLRTSELTLLRSVSAAWASSTDCIAPTAWTNVLADIRRRLDAIDGAAPCASPAPACNCGTPRGADHGILCPVQRGDDPDSSPPFTPAALDDFAARGFVRENRRATDSSSATPPVIDLLPGLRTSPEKAREFLRTFKDLPNADAWLVALIDGAVRHAIDGCVAAIRTRAEYMREVEYVDNVIFGVRNVAYWLESSAGQECLAAQTGSNDR